jgi:hypothetical protein
MATRNLITPVPYLVTTSLVIADGFRQLVITNDGAVSATLTFASGDYELKAGEVLRWDNVGMLYEGFSIDATGTSVRVLESS